MEVRSWFLNEFPQVKDELIAHRQKVQAILDEAEKKASQRKLEKLMAELAPSPLTLVA